MLLFTQSRQVGFVLSITKLKENKEEIYKFRDHRNSVGDIVADTSSPVTTEMDGNPISVRVFRPWFNRFHFNAHYPN